MYLVCTPGTPYNIEYPCCVPQRIRIIKFLSLFHLLSAVTYNKFIIIYINIYNIFNIILYIYDHIYMSL